MPWRHVTDWSKATIPECQDLIWAMIAGVPDAIELFFSERGFGPLIRDAVWRYGSSIPQWKYNAEDLFNEAVVAIMPNDFQSLRTWLHAPRCQLGTWIYQIVKNTCIDIYRGNATEETYQELLGEIFSNRRVSQQEVKRIKRIVWSTLPHLSPKYQEVITLKLEGYTIQEIARIVGISFRAANSRYDRAKDELKKVLSEHWPELFGGSGEKS